MRPEVYWIDRTGTGLLGIMPRPRGGDWLSEELLALAKAGVNVLVSLLTAGEAAELELRDEAHICGDCGIRFVSFPIPDRGVPMSMPDAAQCVDSLGAELSSGKKVAIHCRMGIGRSALLAACLLATEGANVDEAFAMISRARGFPVPDTEEQREWVNKFAQLRNGDENSDNYRDLREIPARTWPEIVAFYRELAADDDSPWEPMLRLVEQIGESGYVAGLFPYTSMFTLCMAHTHTIRRSHEELRILYDPEGHEFHFEYWSHPYAKPEPWRRTCGESEGFATLERILLKRLRWFMKTS